MSTRRQRIAAYNVCLDEDDRLLLCRLTAITGRAGWWTLPGGGVEFGEHPEAAARRELHEEAGLVGRIVELLAVDSIARTIDWRHAPDVAESAEYHSVRIVYRTEVIGGTLRDEPDGTTDQAAWFHRDELAARSLVEMGKLGVDLAFGGSATRTRTP